MRRFVLRLVNVFRFGRAEDELEREVESHLGLLEEELRGKGLSAEDARVQARRAFGGVEQVKDRHRDARSLIWLDDLGRDIRYALRGMARTPGFTAVVLVTLALGMGANTAIFSVVNAVLLRPLSYAADSDRLVRLMMSVPAAQSPTGVARRFAVLLNDAERRSLLSRSRTLSHVASALPVLRNWQGRDPRVQAARMSVETFEMLGATPLIGRRFETADEAPGAAGAALISYATWQRHFGGDLQVLGQTMMLEGIPGPSPAERYLVVGVMPQAFTFPTSQVQLWLSMQTPASGAAPRGPTFGWLAPGASLAAADAEVAALVRQIRDRQPDNASARYQLVRERDEAVASVRPALIVLSGAVAIVLLIACVNVANLFVARALVRRQEMAIRAALGAGRGRLARQLLTETLLLALMGGMAGVLLAFGGVQLFRVLATTLARIDLGNQLTFPRLEEIHVDARALAFTCAASLATGLMCGLAPAFAEHRSQTAAGFQSAGRTSSTGFGFRRSVALRNVLVIAELALALTLSIAGGLLIRSFVGLSNVDTGYERDHVLTFQVDLPGDVYTVSRVKTFSEALATRLAAMPAIQAAGYARQLPAVNLQDSFALRRTPEPPAVPGPYPNASDTRIVSTGYLEALGIRVVTGRSLTNADGPGRPRVLLINETLAKRDFPGATPVGQSVYLGRDSIPWEIVGVVRDVRHFGLDREPGPQLYASISQWPESSVGVNGRVFQFPLFPAGAYYAVRTSGEPMALVPGLRRIVTELDHRATLYYVAPLGELVDTTVARPRMYAVLLGIFSAVAGVLALIGIYGLMAYTVEQRTREIGIRMALGARRIQVLTLVLGHAIVLLCFGLVSGTAGAAAVTRYLEGMLFGLTPLDAGTFAAVAGLFALVAVLAALVPALRATRIEPTIALRTE